MLETQNLLRNFQGCIAVFHQTLAGQGFLQKSIVYCIKFDEKMTNHLNSSSYVNVSYLLAFLLSVTIFSRISVIKGVCF